MESSAWLLGLCAAMFVGSFAAGVAPLCVRVRPGTLKMITVLGAGLLVGAALIVVIPEGVAMHYEALASASRPATRVSSAALARARLAGAAQATIDGDDELEAAGGVDGVATDAANTPHDHVHRRLTDRSAARESVPHVLGEALGRILESSTIRVESGDGAAAEAPPPLGRNTAAAAPAAAASGKRIKPLQSKSTDTHEHGESLGHLHDEGHWRIGAALAAGFVFQVLVDQLSGGGHPHPPLPAEDDDARPNGHSASAASASASALATAPYLPSLPSGGGGSTGDVELHALHHHDAGASHIPAPPPGIADRPLPSGMGGGRLTRGGDKRVGTSSPSAAGGATSGGGSGGSQATVAVVSDKAGTAVPRAVAAAAAADRDAGDGSGAAASQPPLATIPPVVAETPLSPNVARRSHAAMVGLVVHSAVDGVAMGAAVANGDAALRTVVFAAIMLHKAPSALGLATYLLHQRMSVAAVRRRLILFSAAAPLGALLTYALLSLHVIVASTDGLSLCLLFSGGTFLYVATAHILPEVQQGHGHSSSGEGGGRSGRRGSEDPGGFPGASRRLSVEGSGSHSHGRGGGGHGHTSDAHGFTWRETVALVAGVLLPLVINVGHGH